MSAYNPNIFNHIQVNMSNNVQRSNNHKNKKISMLTIGRLFISVAIVSVMLISLFLFRSTASEPVSYELADNEVFVTVNSGDTLWSIASNHYDYIEDTGYAVYLIKQRNQLTSSTIMPGDQLVLPSVQ